MFLAEGREDEVGIRDRQKIALRLCPLICSLTPNSARADCDERLPNLIPRSTRIGVRVNKGREPGLLVWLQQLTGLPRTAHQDGQTQHNDCRLLEPDAAKEEPADQNRQIGQGRSQIRLLEEI